MNSKLSDDQLNLIDSIAKENNFVHYDIRTSPISQKGGNFLGDVASVTIQNGEKKLNLVIKLLQTDEQSSSKIVLHEMYKREIYFYKTVAQAFKKFEEEHEIKDPFTASIPKYYGSIDIDRHECIVLDNLISKGYKHWNKRIPMNEEHLTAVLKEFAYFHSISLALNAKQPKIFEDIVAPIKKTLMEKFWQEKDLQEFISGLMKNGYESVGDDLELKEYLERLEPKIIEFFITELLKDDHKLVVAQSDCWCNNFLFKYQAPNDSKPSKVCILDWQIVHVNSPVYDLAYFFLLAASKDDLNQYEKYMDNYYEVLRNRLISFGCDPDEVFSYSTFKKHCKIFFPLQLLICFMMFKIMLCDSDEAPRILDALGDGVGFADKLNFVMKDRSECDQRVKDVVQFMKERNMGFLE